jgi:hypothetical protein
VIFKFSVENWVFTTKQPVEFVSAYCDFTKVDRLVLNRGKGKELRNIQNTDRVNYSTQANRQLSIYWLGFYALILLPSLWVLKLYDIQIIFVA